MPRPWKWLAPPWTDGRPATRFRAERDALAAAVIRLSRATPQATPGPLAEQLIAEAAEGGAAAGLEARIWAAVVLLDTPGQREAALALAEQATADLDAAGRPGDGRGPVAAAAGLPRRPRRPARPHRPAAGPAGHLRRPRPRRMPPLVVRRAVDGPGADIRLQNILLEAELAALPCRGGG